MVRVLQACQWIARRRRAHLWVRLLDLLEALDVEVGGAFRRNAWESHLQGEMAGGTHCVGRGTSWLTRTARLRHSLHLHAVLPPRVDGDADVVNNCGNLVPALAFGIPWHQRLEACSRHTYELAAPVDGHHRQWRQLAHQTHRTTLPTPLGA